MPVSKIYKYSLVALSQSDVDTTFEFDFEDEQLIHENDQRTFLVDHTPTDFKIQRVFKINHIETPNHPYHYQLFALALR
jgi:hypothetical protein